MYSFQYGTSSMRYNFAGAEMLPKPTDPWEPLPKPIYTDPAIKITQHGHAYGRLKGLGAAGVSIPLAIDPAALGFNTESPPLALVYVKPSEGQQPMNMLLLEQPAWYYCKPFYVALLGVGAGALVAGSVVWFVKRR